MKVAIIGAGMVGSAAGFALILKGIAKELVFVDLDEARARAEAEDIAHAVPFAAPAVVRHGGYADIAGAGVVILACGVSQKPGESRLALLERNAEVFRAVVGEVMAAVPTRSCWSRPTRSTSWARSRKPSRACRRGA
jgi:L-lactate dehydrogenase